tara:strand:+ start:83 stop:553 length:471 start_codon:yes stop_codon:yes gene_type:complete
MSVENNLSESYSKLIEILNDFKYHNTNQKNINDGFLKILEVVEEIKNQTFQSMSETLEISKNLDKSIKESISESELSSAETAKLVGSSKEVFAELVSKMEAAIRNANERDTLLIDKLRDEVKDMSKEVVEIKKILSGLDSFVKASRSEKRALKKKS